ncbi:MAG: molecular chaperone TorD family protein, partial [Lachnospiraceae bacterium]|nr:molecular chaperone TorD family protein [Lachnospiraceae bacterium]
READPNVYRTVDDHIGLMLEYQGLLCGELADALEAGDTAKAEALLAEQREILKKHLMNWVLSFTADVIRYAERDFYKGIARITSGFLKKEAELLEKGVSAWDIA